MVKNTPVDHLVPFGPLWNVVKPAMFGQFDQKWTIFGPSVVMNVGPQRKKKAHHQVFYVWPACKTPTHSFWNPNMAAIYEKCQK